MAQGLMRAAIRHYWPGLYVWPTHTIRRVAVFLMTDAEMAELDALLHEEMRAREAEHLNPGGRSLPSPPPGDRNGGRDG